MLYKPVFVLGLHRTGSTLVKNILNANSALVMANDEMQIYMPLLKTFASHFRGFKKLEKSEKISAIINLVYEKNIRGTFWKEYKTYNIKKKSLRKRLENCDLNLKSVISVLLDEYRLKTNKNRVGAKYPLHYSRFKLLKEWYPNSKIIFLNRDIRAICASKLNDEASKRRILKYGKIIHYVTLLVFVIDYNFFVKFYLKNKRDIYKIDYEKIIDNPEKEIRLLCDFCELPFEKKMLTTFGKPSSHFNRTKHGIDSESYDSWKKKLNKFDIKLIEYLTFYSRLKIKKWT